MNRTTAYALPDLPDCAVCGAPVVLIVDADGGREVCVGCGNAQKPIPPTLDRAAIRQAVAQVKATRPLLCPSCLGRRCRNCHVATCECPRNHPRRNRAAS